VSTLLFTLYVNLFVPMLAQVQARCDLARGLRPGADLVAGNILGLSTYGSYMVVIMVVLVVFTIAFAIGRRFLNAALWTLGALFILGWVLTPFLNTLTPTTC
jgi:hypothetical protein